MQTLPDDNITLVSLLREDGQIEAFLERRPMPVPNEGEVLVKILAAPINPSDILLLFDGADLSRASASSRDGLPSITAPVDQIMLRTMQGRVGQPLPVGNEASGTVVGAGSSSAAQALLGKTVAIYGGGTYTQYRCVPAAFCMELPPGTDIRVGASSFVNPLTALGFVETAKAEGHSAIVHTAAASNLGQMLNRICLTDGVPLVNVVRSPAQVALLRQQGAEHVLDTSSKNFEDELAVALAATGATLAFDAIGGGLLGGRLIAAMEGAAIARMPTYSRYGSDTFKQLYIYGRLDTSTTLLNPVYGFRWAVSGWLLTPFLANASAVTFQRLRERVARELTTTFASTYSDEIPIEQALDVDVVHAYAAKRTGAKYLIRP